MRRSLKERLNFRNTSDRALANLMVAGLENIKNYGCWCYLEGSIGKGKSNPIQSCSKISKKYEKLFFENMFLTIFVRTILTQNANLYTPVTNASNTTPFQKTIPTAFLGNKITSSNLKTKTFPPVVIHQT